MIDHLPAAAARSYHDRRFFNRLWLGQGISVFGSQITALALPLTAVVYLNASATQVGLLATAREAAFVGLMLFFGVVVDRHRRRPVMIVADLGRAAVTFAVPALAWFDLLSMPVLYLVAFLLGSLAVMFNLAYRAYLPTLLKTDTLLAGNGRLQATESVSEVAGPGLAGVLIQVMRAPFALLIDSISFAVSALSVASIRSPEPSVAAEVTSGSFVRGVLADIRSGLAVTLRDPILRALAGASAVFNVFATIMLTIFVVYAARTAHMSPGEIGVVFGGFGVGGVLAATSLSQTMAIGVGRLLTMGYIVGATAIVALPFVGGPAGLRTVVLTAVFFVAGCAIVSANIVEMTVRQTATPNALQGRVAAGFGFLIGVLSPTAAFVAGVLGDQIGPHARLMVAAAGVPLSLPWIVFSQVRRVRTLDDLKPDEPIQIHDPVLGIDGCAGPRQMFRSPEPSDQVVLRSRSRRSI